jgi:parallel beta-helix repeat protein
MVSLAVCIVLASGGAASAKDYYVSPTGDDGKAGTSVGEAFKTIDRAAKMAVAGDVVNVAPGTYVGRIRPAASGTAESPITIRRHGDGEVVVTTSKETDGGKWEERAVLKLGKGNNHFVIEGLVFRDAESWIYIGDTAHHNTIKNCTFDRNRMYHGIYINSGSWNRIVGCKFLAALPFPPGWDGTQKNPPLADYITIWRDSHFNLIEDCKFHEITHVAVALMGHDPEYTVTHTIVRNCTFHNPKWKCVSFHAAEDTLVEGCRMYGLAASFFQYQGRRAIVRRNILHHFRSARGGHPSDYSGALWLRSGINEYGGVDDARLGRIYNNTFYRCQKATAYGPRKWALPVCENVFKNNIFVGGEYPLILPKPFFAHWTVHNANTFTRNIILGKKPGEKIIELVTVDERVKYTLKEIAEADRKLCKRDVFVDNIESDPMLLLNHMKAKLIPAKMSREHFAPIEGSPCIDAGADLTTTTSAGKGRVVPVADPLYFCDGWGMIDGDRVILGKAGAATIVKVDRIARTLTLDRDLAWQSGDAVNLTYSGKAPDIGAVELIKK